MSTTSIRCSFCTRHLLARSPILRRTFTAAAHPLWPAIKTRNLSGPRPGRTQEKMPIVPADRNIFFPSDHMAVSPTSIPHGPPERERGGWSFYLAGYYSSDHIFLEAARHLGNVQSIYIPDGMRLGRLHVVAGRAGKTSREMDGTQKQSKGWSGAEFAAAKAVGWICHRKIFKWYFRN